MSGLRRQKKIQCYVALLNWKMTGILWVDIKTLHYNITAPFQREVFHSQQHKGESVDHS